MAGTISRLPFFKLFGTKFRTKNSIMMVAQKCKTFTLKTLRKKLKMTQEAFAEALGVRRATISDWERGKNSPTLNDDQLETLAKMLKSANMELIDLFSKDAA